MSKRIPLIDDNGEVRELTAADMRVFKPASEVLPLTLQKTLGMRPRGPQKAPTKVSTTIRLSNEVVQAFRATGDGWQTRVDAALKDWLKTHSPV
ncbi:BrnA antitoxin family protein [Rhodoferax ferrireducens]|uniref:BrnA antitoxin family protein n=1 Tax=Rhodoferax ferrireducens TaxID=192843 RepID=UPI000E0CC4F5|nr:BrnA antitoxin family protein [Rhodoferax ferrireducens]